jgi:hypothetical protein
MDRLHRDSRQQVSSVFPPLLFDTEGTNHSQLDALLKYGIGHVSALGVSLLSHEIPNQPRPGLPSWSL